MGFIVFWKRNNFSVKLRSRMFRRWEKLVDLAVMLRLGKVNLDDLVTQIDKKISEKTGHDRVLAGDHDEKETSGSLKITSINSRKVLDSTLVQDSVSWRATVKKRNKRRREGEEEILEKRRRILYYHHHLLLDQHGRITATWRKPIKKRNSGKVLNRIQDSVSCNAKMKRKASKRTRAPETEAEPILTEEIKKRILDLGGCEQSVCFVIKKPLYQSDVNAQQCRLSIPHGKINNKFFNKLDQTEAGRLESEAEGIGVILFGYGGEEYEMNLRNWKSNSMYALVGHWKHVCRRDTLKVGQQVQVWCFRRDSHLCFALF